MNTLACKVSFATHLILINLSYVDICVCIMSVLNGISM
jgi:hypothetical protein